MDDMNGIENMDDLLPKAVASRDEMLQFYRWTEEDAEKAQEAWVEKRNGVDGPGGPFFRWEIAQYLKKLYQWHIKRGRDAASPEIMEALLWCSFSSLPIPRWCEKAYRRAYARIRLYKAKSWDDVFGRPYPKGTHIEAKRQALENGCEVYLRIKEIKEENPSIPIDGHLFERVGRELGVGGKTLTEECYYRRKKEMEGEG